MIIHLDLDSFFASAHRSIDKSLCNIPIAVGGRSNLKIFQKDKVNIKLYNSNSGAFVNPIFYNNKKDDFRSFFVDKKDNKEKIRGIITTASYEARAYGVKTGMSVNEALMLCPNLIVLPPNYLLYHTLSYDLYKFLQIKIPKVEQFSIDEFFGDLSGWISDDEVFKFAQMLQIEIKDRFKLPISIGVSSGKWIAKLATEFAKPNGIYVVKKGCIDDFIKDIPVEMFPGIGRGFAKRLRKHFIFKLGDVKENRDLFYSWKKPGKDLYHKIVGDEYRVITDKSSRKSIGISRTFDPIKSREEIKRRINILARHIIFLVLQEDVHPTTYSIRVKYDFQFRLKNRKTVDRLFSESLCKSLFLEMFEEIDIPYGYITKLSMSVSNFTLHKPKVFSLIDFEEDQKYKKVTKILHKLRKRYSIDIIKTGNEL